MSVAVTARAERDQRTGELPPAAPDVEAGGPVHRPSRLEREPERLRLHARVGVVEPWFSLLEHLAVVARPEVALTHRLAPCRRDSGHGSSLSTGSARGPSAGGPAAPQNSSRSAPAPASTPSRRSTFHAVSTRIFRSSANEALSTYHASSSSRVSQSSALRPWICAHPVMPGLISWRRRWREL